jgi:hypothetical protein
MARGFGQRINWGIRNMAEFRGKFYLGTAQCYFPRCLAFVTGTEIWEWSGG